MEGRNRPRLNQVAFRCDWEDCRRLALGYYPARIAVRQKLSPYRFCRPAHQQSHWRKRQREARLAAAPARFCPLCGRAIPPEDRPGRPRRYCSPEHAAAAANKRRLPAAPAKDLADAARNADRAAQEARAEVEAAAERAQAASQEADHAVQFALVLWAGKEKVELARGLVDEMKATLEQARAAKSAGREAEVMSLRDDLRTQRERVKANDLAGKLFLEWQDREQLVAAQAAAAAQAAHAERANEALDNDKRRRDRRAAAARRRRAEGARPLAQNHAGLPVYPSWHTLAGQEIRE